MRDMIYNGFILTYTLFLVMELLSLIISDVGLVLVVRFFNCCLITFCYYLRKMSGVAEGGDGKGRRFLLYQSLLRGFILGDCSLYFITFWLPSPLFLSLFVSFSFLVGLARAFYEYGKSHDLVPRDPT